jgi:hypothetical protein
VRAGSAGVIALSLGLAACGGSAGSVGPRPVAPSDPTAGNKCRIASGQDSPLVTEWPASEKARLESLAARQVVAVAYSGCELRIVDSCRVPGSYSWRPTTLATDTVEISDADELYAKLPLGAVGLEGQLQRSGRLAVKTTVSGHLELAELPTTLPATGACAGVTHLVKGISVGAFRLVSGGSIATGGGAEVAGVGAGAKTRSEENVMREAGDPARCGESTETAPHAQCASPIQVFLVPAGNAPSALTPVAPSGGTGGMSEEQRARELGGVFIALPGKEDELWSLRDGSGRVLCELPCSRWIPPASGYRLERQTDQATVDVPDRFGNPPGSSVAAEYRPERGYPLFAALSFYGMGIPCAIGGTVLLIRGLTVEDDPNDPTGSDKGFYIGSSVMFFSIALGTAAWYFLFSDWESFETRSQPAARRHYPNVVVGPGALGGYF